MEVELCSNPPNVRKRQMSKSHGIPSCNCTDLAVRHISVAGLRFLALVWQLALCWQGNSVPRLTLYSTVVWPIRLWSTAAHHKANLNIIIILSPGYYTVYTRLLAMLHAQQIVKKVANTCNYKSDKKFPYLANNGAKPLITSRTSSLTN